MNNYFINKLNIKKKCTKKILYFADFETVVFKNQHYITCISIKENNENNTFPPKSYSIHPYNNENYNLKKESTEVMANFINDLLFKYRDVKTSTNIYIYFHNLGRFDGFFILNYFINLKDINLNNLKVITRDNRIYQIIFTHELGIKDRVINLIFRDSFLLFPHSLSTMCDMFFGKQIQKMNFNEFNTPIEEYNTDFIIKLNEYCKHDVEILLLCMNEYSKIIKDEFNINVYDNLTLSSLSLKIFRTHFYKNESIYKSRRTLDTFIRESYKGGVVDVYKPYLVNGYHYDVNSLYPYVMSNNYMPVGKPNRGFAFNDKNFNIHNFFGFIKVKVTSPDNMYIPFLTTRSSDGLISPLGSWTDIYFSEEIKYALTLGYSFEYLDYYEFDKEIIFKDYVEQLYNKRVANKEKKPELSNIYKLLLNSLYGRFGMRNTEFHNIFLKNNKTDSQKFKEINLIYSNTQIVDEYIINNESLKLVRFEDNINKNLLYKLSEIYLKKDIYLDDQSFSKNVSVQIASAITSYARIFMHKIKVRYSDSLYYSDTDSLVTDKEIDSSDISSSKIGLFKLEGKIKKAIFIAPKLYYMKLEHNDIVKAKGVKQGLASESHFIKLYENNPIKFEILKSFIRSFKDFTIKSDIAQLEIKGQLLKREKILDKNGKWINTKPLFYKEKN